MSPGAESGHSGPNRWRRLGPLNSNSDQVCFLRQNHNTRKDGLEYVFDHFRYDSSPTERKYRNMICSETEQCEL